MKIADTGWCSPQRAIGMVTPKEDPQAHLLSDPWDDAAAQPFLSHPQRQEHWKQVNVLRIDWEPNSNLPSPLGEKRSYKVQLGLAQEAGWIMLMNSYVKTALYSLQSPFANLRLTIGSLKPRDQKGQDWNDRSKSQNVISGKAQGLSRLVFCRGWSLRCWLVTINGALIPEWAWSTLFYARLCLSSSCSPSMWTESQSQRLQ